MSLAGFSGLAATLAVTLSCALLVASVAAGPEADVHFQRALDYEFHQDIDAAIAEYRRGLELDPNSLAGHANLGVLLLNEWGDVDGAISEFMTALGIDPENAFAQTHLNEAVALRNSTADEDIERGNNYYRAGQLVRAAAAYRIACYVAPKNAEAHNSLAWTLYRLGKLNDALKEVTTALRLAPEDAEYINTLACVLYDRGDAEGAMKEFERAIAHSKKVNAADLYGLAVVFFSQGDKQRAADNFKQALQNDPNFADARYLRDKIGMSVHALASHESLLDLSGVKKNQ
ncbi:MAG TPA: tetratricopeptide repeat protein [Candidatus Obscuribacterales bacterium]